MKFILPLLKYTLLEPSLRVPLVMRIPDQAPRRCTQAVSHVDRLPTLLDLASGGHLPDPVDPLDGHSVVPLLQSKHNDPGRVVRAQLQADVDARWDVVRLSDGVLRSQRRRPVQPDDGQGAGALSLCGAQTTRPAP